MDPSWTRQGSFLPHPPLSPTSPLSPFPKALQTDCGLRAVLLRTFGVTVCQGLGERFEVAVRHPDYLIDHCFGGGGLVEMQRQTLKRREVALLEFDRSGEQIVD